MFHKEIAGEYKLQEKEVTFTAFPLFFSALNRIDNSVEYEWRTNVGNAENIFIICCLLCVDCYRPIICSRDTLYPSRAYSFRRSGGGGYPDDSRFAIHKRRLYVNHRPGDRIGCNNDNLCRH